MQVGKQGQATQMVEVAMGKQNEIEGTAGYFFVTGQRIIPSVFGMQARIDRKLKRADFAVSAVGSDPSMGIKVANLHELEGGAEESTGTSKRKGSIRTCTLLPCSSTP